MMMNPDISTGACAALSSSAATKARVGEDLLRQLPMDREANCLSSAPVVAAAKMSSISRGSLSSLASSLGVGCDTIFLTAFSTLLARLAGQEIVNLCDITAEPVTRTFVFNDEASFRSIVRAACRENPPDQPGAVEYAGSVAAASARLPPNSLRLGVQISTSACELKLASSTGLWSEPILRLWLRYFDHLLAAVAADPDASWKTLPLLSRAEAQAFYRDFNNTAEPYPGNMCIHDLVMRQVELSPDAVAVASESESLSYWQLHERSSAIADRLQKFGAGPNRPVVVCLERTAELPVALLGILKAGSCYVPLDPRDARPRVEAILKECCPVAIIADESFSIPQGMEAIPVIRPHQDQGSSYHPESKAAGVTPYDRAYVIYTSGTTGKPKGVPILHRALVNFITSVRRKPGFTPADRMLAVAPISFDIATMDMFLPLVSGGTLVIADRLAAADPLRLAAMLKEFEITVMQATPVTWRLLASSHWEGKSDLRMFSGGEALPRDLANHLLLKGRELWNFYGPTETTIYSGLLRIQSQPQPVLIGPPIANTTFYVLDHDGRLLPPGVPGELYIGGIGVSPGYVEPPQGSLPRFLPDPYAEMPGARMFRSGDLVRLVNGNEFEFFGRLDHQVKLRGYRIELGEIEFALRTHPDIQNAVAALCDRGPAEPYLIAYVTALDQKLDLRRLRDHVSQLLPGYMVPSRFVLLEKIPLTGSGKIDRKALLDSASRGLSAYHQPEGVVPSTKLEERLLSIFRDVLNTPKFGVTDSFFDYGGYSLLTVKLFTRINRALNLRLPISLVFDTPNVRSLAKTIEDRSLLTPIVGIRSQGRSVPLFVIHSYLLYGVLPQIVEPDRPVYGVRESPEVPDAQAVGDLAAAYVNEILKVNPDGPLMLTGWCAAASLTLEVARQLRERNHDVGLVALLDAERPGYRPAQQGKRLAVLSSRLKFHWRRLRAFSRQEKLRYVLEFFGHLWDRLLENIYVRHRPWVLRLQRRFGTSLPRTLFDNPWFRIGALQNYTPVNYPGKVVLFRAEDDPDLRGGDETMGWKEIVEGGVEVVFVPGDHETMFQEPNIYFLSQRFRQALQLAE